MAPTEETAETIVRQRKSNHTPDEAAKQHNGGVSENINDVLEWKRHMEGVKVRLLEDMSCHMRILLDKAVTEAVESYTRVDKPATQGLKPRPHEPVTERKKVFLQQASLLDDLMEVEHFRTIYHMFVAALCVFVISTAAVDIIDQGRLVLEFDLLFYTFGQFGTVVWSWICLFIYTLLVPYKVLSFWGSVYPKSEHKFLLSACVGTFLLVSQTCALCIFPVIVVKHYQLPPASSFIVILEQVEHFRTIYHMFVAALCVFVISTAAVDIIDQGRLVLEFDLLFYTFGQFGTVVWSWICLFIYTLLVPYKVLSFWGSVYPKSEHKFLLSACVGTFLLVSQTCALCIFPVIVVKHYQLPPASSFIVILEQVRLLMKSYSFLRETVPIVIQNESKEKKFKIPELSSYLYFLFCPTLVYRERYPRTPYIRWKYVAKNFAQFLGCLFFGYFILVTLCIPVFKNMSKQPFNTKTLVLSIFHSTLPGTFVLLLSFFAFLHCWLNAFAEMLRFADRMFYKDWWNSTSFSNYYRTWNVVVHDWLYYYIYQDLLWLLKNRCRTGVMLAVFFISASVHEYVFTLSLGYFYPVMFCLFAICGVVFNFTMNDKRTSPVWNVLMWTFLFIGQGIQLCLYCQEWYAQIHCPLTEKTFWGMVTPRSWSCRL